MSEIIQPVPEPEVPAEPKNLFLMERLAEGHKLGALLSLEELLMRRFPDSKQNLLGNNNNAWLAYEMWRKYG